MYVPVKKNNIPTIFVDLAIYRSFKCKNVHPEMLLVLVYVMANLPRIVLVCVGVEKISYHQHGRLFILSIFIIFFFFFFFLLLFSQKVPVKTSEPTLAPTSVPTSEPTRTLSKKKKKKKKKNHHPFFFGLLIFGFFFFFFFCSFL